MNIGILYIAFCSMCAVYSISWMAAHRGLLEDFINFVGAVYMTYQVIKAVIELRKQRL